jgi:16S rRNA (uracil1498-N3)-methyltransferase
MSERFYVAPSENLTIEITDAEARHISRVMRLGAGDKICLFDGKGRECEATIESVDKNKVTALADNWVTRSVLPANRVTIFSALPKSDRLKFMVEKLTELGATKLVPLATSRASVRPKPNTIAKMRRHVIEASKQCGRNELMIVGDECSIKEAVQLPLEDELRFICEPHNGATFQPVAPGEAKPCNFLVGPEGGFSDEELEIAANNNWSPIHFGKSILRVETAAMVACIAGNEMLSGAQPPPG